MILVSLINVSEELIHDEEDVLDNGHPSAQGMWFSVFWKKKKHHQLINKLARRNVVHTMLMLDSQFNVEQFVFERDKVILFFPLINGVSEIFQKK